MDRAYSLLTVKTLDEETRLIEGWATTPSVDRVGDVIEPLGVKFSNPSPLLWMHRHDQPVGIVNFKRPTKEGVQFTAQLPKVEEAGTLRDRVDEAWHSVKAGVVRAVSIGFRALDGAVDPLPGGGARFKKVEVLELSLVSVPANQDATITAVKFYDQGAHQSRASTDTDEGYVPFPRGLPPETRELILDGIVSRKVESLRQELGDDANKPMSTAAAIAFMARSATLLDWHADRIRELEARLGQ